MVMKFEQLGSDPKFLTGDTGSFDTLTDFGFVTVSPSAINVTVAGLFCVFFESTEFLV